VLLGVGKGLTDMGLAARQLYASKFGSPEDQAALQQEAAAKAKTDKPLADTAGGAAGQFIGETAPLVATGAGAGAAVGRATTMLPRALQAAAQYGVNAPGVGAVGGVLTPEGDKPYDPESKAGWGAVTGMAGDALARGVGRVVTPGISKAADFSRAALERLRSEGAPAQLAAQTVGNKGVRLASEALETIPKLGNRVMAAREANREWLTARATEPTGTMLPRVGGDNPDIFRPLEAQANSLRGGPPVSLENMQPAMQQVIDEVRPVAELSTKTGPVRTGERAAEATRLPSSGITNPATGQPFPAPGRTISADEAMTLRSQLSSRLHSARNAPGGWQEAEITQATRNALDDALAASQQHAPVTGPGSMGPHMDVPTWNRRWAAAEKVKEAALHSGNPGNVGPLLPEATLKAHSTSEQFAPSRALAQDAAALAQLQPKNTMGANRALWNQLLLGAATAGPGALLGGLTADDPKYGSMAGAAATMGLAYGGLSTRAGSRYLANEVLSPAARERLRKLLTAGIVGEAN